MGGGRDGLYILDDRARCVNRIILPRKIVRKNTTDFSRLCSGRHDRRLRLSLLIPAIEEAEAQGIAGWLRLRAASCSALHF